MKSLPVSLYQDIFYRVLPIMRPSLSIIRNFVLKHRVFLLRNWEKMREKQELLKREGERERDTGSLSMYTRWGGVIRDDGNIKSGEHEGTETWT